MRIVRDSFGRVVIEQQGEHRINYQYTDKGLLQSIKSSLGADVVYERDKYGQISAIKSGEGEDAWTANIKRNMLGLEIERTLPGGISSIWEYDDSNNPIKQLVNRGQEKTLHRNYSWNAGQQLQKITNMLTGGVTHFSYDVLQSLASAQYEDGTFDYKLPDEIGNLFRTKGRKDRIYGKGGKLLKDENWYYSYDAEGNLRLKSKRNIIQTQLRNSVQTEEKPKKNSFFIEEIKDEKPKAKTLDYYLRTDIKYSKEDKEEYVRLKEQTRHYEENWEQGDWLYTWQANGMLKSVQRPDGSVVSFEYDALGRRTAKIHNAKVSRFVWDGNVLLHEWNYEQKKRPRLSLDNKGEFVRSDEQIENLITWVYEDGSFVPSAKIKGKEKYSIISDYIGRPIQVYNDKGEKVWETEYDIYGKLRNLQGNKNFVPFRQLGQYEDEELDGLYYNRFRYYDCNIGNYISQDPIGLNGSNPNFYAYVKNSNIDIDPSGLNNIPKDFIDKYKDLIEAYKTSIPGRPVDVDADMAEAWKWHQNAKVAVAEGKLPVLGDLSDVQSVVKSSDYYHRLMSERWTPAINDVWIDTLIELKSPFLLVSPTTSDYLDHELFGRSVYGREIDKLNSAGYDVPMNDSTISTKNQKYLKICNG